MAQRVITELIDDLDGSTATETVRFGLENIAFEIDLNGENAQVLRNALQPFLTKARRVGGRVNKATVAIDPSLDLKAVRRWAMDNNIPVNARGRIKTEVVRQYEAANS